MSDMRLNTTHNVNNDTKNRNLMDAVAAEMSNSQFLDIMMSRITAMNSDDAELKALVKKVDSNRGADTADNKALLNRLKDLQESYASHQNEAVQSKAEIRKKVKERIQQISENHTTPVQDTRALKTLQKTAKALLEANEKGDIALPPAIAQKLQDFLAKGDDFKAFDMANFMTEFNEIFRNSVLAMNAGSGEGLTLPADLQDAFAELGIDMPNAENSDMMQIMRALKALVNASQNAAIATLDSQAQENVSQKSQPNANSHDALAALMDGDLPGIKNGSAAQNTVSAAAIERTTNQLKTAKSGVAAKQSNEESLTDMAMNSAFPEQEQRLKGKGSDRNNGDAKSSKVAGAGQAAQGQLASEAKAAFAASAANQAPQSNANAAMTAQSVVDPTLIGIDQGGVSAATASRAAFNAEMQAAARSERPHPAAQQVIMQIAAQKGNKAGQISVQLSPAELGRVEVRMTIQRDGQTHAVIVADKPETLALLQRDASHLERALQQAGINANAGNMSFNLRDEQQAQQSGQERKRFNRTAITEQSGIEASMMVQNESIISDTRINYHA